MLKILVVDDHPVVRRRLKQILKEEADIVEVGEAQNSSEVYALVRNHDWDAVVLNITLPRRGGLEF